MARATIKTIAGAAGVSTATVDRVLNGRVGATAANRQRVFAAAKQLGYLPSEGTVALPARPTRLAFLIPQVTNAFMADITRHMIGFANNLPLVRHCDMVPLDSYAPEKLETALETLSLDTKGVGLVAMDHPRCRAAIDRLCDAGVRVVTIASDVQGCMRSAYVGADNFVAGRTAAQLFGMMLSGQPGRIAVFLGSHAFHGHRERVRGFQSCLEETRPGPTGLPPIETGEQRHRARQSMQALLREVPDLCGVYCIGAGRQGIIEAVQSLPPARRPRIIMHDLTEDTRNWLKQDLIAAVIDQNARLIAEQAVIRLLGAVAAPTSILPLQNIKARVVIRENL